MRSRPHVIITRLNDKELQIWNRILACVAREFCRPENPSEAFRLALRVMDQRLNEEAIRTFYEHLDF